MNPERAKKQEGFTLIEVVVAMGISLIVVLAVGAGMAASHTRWNSAWEKVTLQRDASYVMLRLSRSIKEGASATVENKGKAVRIYDTDGSWVRFIFDSDAGQIQCEFPEQSTESVVDSYVEEVVFDVEDNRVGIDLVLKKDDQEIHLDSTVHMRNYGL